jgi:hypothetical protein
MVTMEHKQSKPTVNNAHLTNLKFKNFKVAEAMRLKIIALNGITSVTNLMKIFQAVQKLLVGDTQTDTETDRQTGDFIGLLPFLESRLK